MRFVKLGFSAFGPFTDLELDLSGGAPGGFHLVLGPNEAGKSSALRGVHDLLFGFPERTKDAHVHPSAELRIAASLAGDAGQVLDIQRLKRRKDSLRDAQDAPIDEAALSALLGGVDAQVFERLFGLDHERLARAGQALLEDKGDVGESLFDAGSGGPGIRRVLAELAEQADEIFKPRSSKARLNVLLEAYKEAKSVLRDAQVFPEKWKEQSQKLHGERARLESLVERRKKLREESIAQTRLQAALGPIAQRNALREKLAALGVVPALPEDARERRERAQRTLDQVTHDRTRLERDSAKKRERLAELVVPEDLLGRELGGHQPATRPRRRLPQGGERSAAPAGGRAPQRSRRAPPGRLALPGADASKGSRRCARAARKSVARAQAAAAARRLGRAPQRSRKIAARAGGEARTR